jgi:predicted MFS family arabinose efflux permease
LGGILLARTFSGTLGDAFGWRVPYFAAALLTLSLAAGLALVIPKTVPPSHESYLSLLSAPLRLLRSEPDLRRSCFYQATMFGAFTAAWTCLALFISGPRYGLGSQTVGVIALVGAASMVCTPIAGRWIDRAGPSIVNLACFLAAIAAATILAAGTLGAITGLIALAAGMLLLDIAVQCGQAANQARIFALRADARSRLNTAYMTCAFLGGTAGSWLGVRAYFACGWPAVCALVTCTALFGLVVHLTRSRQVSAPQACTSRERPRSAKGDISMHAEASVSKPR